MNNSFVPSSGRIARNLAAFGCSLALLTLLAGLAEAQVDPPQTDRLAIDLQARFDQLTRENAALSADITRVSEQLATLGESMRRVEGAFAAPAEAWWALGVVGFTFAIAWGVVSVFRERVREREAEAERSRTSQAAVADQAKMMEAAVDARIKLMIELLREAQKGASGSLAANDLVARASELADSLSRAIARGLEQKGPSTLKGTAS